MTGEIEKSEDGVLVIRRIHVAYRLAIDPDVERDQIERVHGFHAEKCPVARSIRGVIDISTGLDLVES